MARNPNRPSRRRRRDEEPDESRADEGALEGAASDEDEGPPAPDPLKHSSADVDQALLAEAGVARGESGDVEGEDTVAYQDEEYETRPPVDEDRAPARLEGSIPGAAVAPRKERGRVLTFLRNCVEELRRVQWPDRRQVGQATAVVLGFVVLAGGYLGLMDAIWKPIVEAIL
jgi:preprotein translocase SecE subunit